MPKTAQDRIVGGPFAALLILLSLFLASSPAAGGTDLRSSTARPGSTRPGTAALLASGTRTVSDDEAQGAGAGSAALPSGPAIVTETLPARPSADAPSDSRPALPRPAAASYRARAPPAS